MSEPTAARAASPTPGGVDLLSQRIRRGWPRLASAAGIVLFAMGAAGLWADDDSCQPGMQ
jgi:hypothetical protein